MMYICFLLSSFGALYSGQTFCIYMGCTDIGYCVYGICGLWTVFMVMCLWLCVWMCLWLCVWLVFLDVFMDMYLQACISGCVYGYVFMVMCIWLCVWVMCLAMCMAIGSRFSARPGSINIGAYLSLGPVLAIFLGLTPPRGPFQQLLGLTPSRGPPHHHRVLLLHEAHFRNFWDLLCCEAHFSNFLRIFPFFLRRKWKKFAPVCSVE